MYKYKWEGIFTAATEKANDEPAANIEEFHHALSKAQDKVLLLVKRNGAGLFVVLVFQFGFQFGLKRKQMRRTHAVVPANTNERKFIMKSAALINRRVSFLILLMAMGFSSGYASAGELDKVKSTADQALQTAQDAKSSTDTATNTANSALMEADKANMAASGAAKVANEADRAANNALTEADKAMQEIKMLSEKLNSASQKTAQN